MAIMTATLELDCDFVRPLWDISHHMPLWSFIDALNSLDDDFNDIPAKVMFGMDLDDLYEDDFGVLAAPPDDDDDEHTWYPNMIYD